MRVCGRLAWVVGWLVAVTSARAGGLDDFSRDIRGLEGTWNVVKFERDQQDLTASGMTWTIRPDAITIKIQGAKGELAAVAKTPYRLNITNTSRGIDLMPTYPPNNGRTVLGIYSLEGDTLRLCLQRRAAPNRPTEFTSARDSNCELIVLQRKKL
jgi:uncharacterized protein (TIGR03067 family)